MIEALKKKADGFRRDIVKMYYRAGWGHMAPALSCVDILTALSFGGEADFSMTTGKDRMVLSKGHGCAAWYMILAELGYFPREELNTFYQSGSRLLGLASPSVPGIDIPTGALGHGICYATGLAYADKLDDNGKRTYVILGDGESQEGSVWEAAEFAAEKELFNLIVVLDRNGLQASDYLKNILSIEPVREKWQSFGWNVLEADGHSYDELINGIQKAKKSNKKPTIIIAHTIKGKGVSISEGKPEWHSRAPKGDEWMQVCEELGITKEELGKI